MAAGAVCGDGRLSRAIACWQKDEKRRCIICGVSGEHNTAADRKMITDKQPQGNRPACVGMETAAAIFGWPDYYLPFLVRAGRSPSR